MGFSSRKSDEIVEIVFFQIYEMVGKPSKAVQKKHSRRPQIYRSQQNQQRYQLQQSQQLKLQQQQKELRLELRFYFGLYVWRTVLIGSLVAFLVWVIVKFDFF